MRTTALACPALSPQRGSIAPASVGPPGSTPPPPPCLPRSDSFCAYSQVGYRSTSLGSIVRMSDLVSGRTSDVHGGERSSQRTYGILRLYQVEVCHRDGRHGPKQPHRGMEQEFVSRLLRWPSGAAETPLTPRRFSVTEDGFLLRSLEIVQRASVLSATQRLGALGCDTVRQASRRDLIANIVRPVEQPVMHGTSAERWPRIVPAGLT